LKIKIRQVGDFSTDYNPAALEHVSTGFVVRHKTVGDGSFFDFFRTISHGIGFFIILSGKYMRNIEYK
jgi:hypothetical protein